MCHEEGFPHPLLTHNYLLLLANVRSVIISILQRTCGYRRLNNSWSHSHSSMGEPVFLLRLCGLERHSPFSLTRFHGALWYFTPHVDLRWTFDKDAQPGVGGGTHAYSHRTICKTFAHIILSRSLSSLESEAECELGFTEDRIASGEAIT